MNLCYEIAVRLYRYRMRNRQLDADSRDSAPERYWQWQFETSADYFPKFWNLLEVISGKRVLDIGCGLGGRTCYLATKAPQLIVGTDINAHEIDQAGKIANEQLDSEAKKRVKFIKVDESKPPDLEPFDIVLLVDSFEHLKNPVAMLDLAYSMVHPGGVCYFSTMGWYNHRGAHIGSIVPIPFVNVFFSDRCILDALRRILSSPYYVPDMWDSNPPVRRWEGITDLKDRPGEYLNKITVRGIKDVVAESAFIKKRVRVTGFSWRKFSVLRCLNFLARIPVIQEVYHSVVFGRLEKGDGHEPAAPL